MGLFKGLVDYHSYIQTHPFYLDLGLEVPQPDLLISKVDRSAFESVDDSKILPVSAELDDLIRLHYLITSRKATTVLEFGGGKSSVAIDSALTYNKAAYIDYVSANMRRSNLFECHSVDNNKNWLELTKKSHNFQNVIFHHCPCHVSTFNSRVCTYYDGVPNICPDLIYLDGPDQSSPTGSVRGINTNHPDRVPMAADLLAMEHFLLPGTLIVVDGRTANARFLKTNFQRNWEHSYFEEYDQHFFELKESPLGRYNLKQIQFCLGQDWIDALSVEKTEP